MNYEFVEARKRGTNDRKEMKVDHNAKALNKSANGNEKTNDIQGQNNNDSETH